MPDNAYIATFLIGLLGGVHCAGMCGGIVGALTVNTPGGVSRWPIHLAYNLGRISTYVATGAVMGAVGSLGLLMENILPIQIALYVMANLMLVALGIYLAGYTPVLAFVERAGQHLWLKIRPFTSRFMPVRSVFNAYPLGLMWGFLPCGLVYSVLTLALVSGSSARGAGLMLAFGLGTLPNLLLAGMLLVKLRTYTHSPRLRLIAGLLVAAFGLYGLYYAADPNSSLWQGVLCHT